MALDDYGKILIRGLYSEFYEKKLHSSFFIQKMIELEHPEYKLTLALKDVSDFLRETGREDLDHREAVLARIIYLTRKEKKSPLDIAPIITRDLRPAYALTETSIRGILKKNGIEAVKTPRGNGGTQTMLCKVRKEGFKRRKIGKRISYQSFCSVPETL